MIFLFAGHGGLDTGAVGVNGRKESVETIKLRNLIKSYLPSTAKVFIDDDRDTLATVLKKAVTGEGSVVLDLHFNASSNPIASGVEVLVGDDATEADLLLAKDILSTSANTLRLRSRGIKREGETPRKRLGVMREHGAVCLLEVCFISNRDDMAAYDAAIDILARSIADILVKHDGLR